MFAFLSSSKLKENLTELHIIVRTTGSLMQMIFSIHCSAVIGLAMPIAMVVLGDQNRWVDESVKQALRTLSCVLRFF